MLNDTADCTAVVDKLMQKHNLGRLSIERYRRETCFPVINFYKALGFDFDKVSFTDIANDYMQDYEQRVAGSQLQPESQNCLNVLTNLGFTHSVLSAYEQSRLEFAIEYFGLTSYFKHIIGLSDLFARSKVENGKWLIGQLEHPPEEVVLIGDTTHDHEVAEAMGIDCVLMTNGHQSPEHFIKTGRKTFGSISEVLMWLTQ